MANDYAGRTSGLARLPNSPMQQPSLSRAGYAMRLQTQSSRQMDPVLAANWAYEDAARAHQLNPSEITEQALEDAGARLAEVFEANVIKNKPLLKTGQGFDEDAIPGDPSAGALTPEQPPLVDRLGRPLKALGR